SGVSRSQVVDFILNSPERTAHVIGQYYQQYLGRAATAADEQGWANLLAAGALDFESVAELFLSSSEFFNDASARSHSAALGQIDALDALLTAELATDSSPTTAALAASASSSGVNASSQVAVQVAATADNRLH
ncbi:MAG: DUF4214 domain-containing protein, partial [Pirellulales bacterium]